MSHPTGASMADLMAAVPEILNAPVTDAPISTLCYRETFGARAFVDDLLLDKMNGVHGDRWQEHAWLRRDDGMPDPRIQVSILPRRTYDAVVGRHDASTLHPGDTIIADMNMTEANLPTGTLIGAGTAVLRVSDVFNDGCVKWRARYGDTAKEWINLPDHIPLRLRGVLCEIVQSGVIKRSDRLIKLPA